MNIFECSYTGKDREEVEKVLDYIIDIIRDYGFMSIYDFEEVVGDTKFIKFNHTQYGWTNTKDMMISKVLNGYKLSLPRPKLLNNDSTYISKNSIDNTTIKINTVTDRVIYLCDRRACAKCSPECKHTNDIRHAKNFEMTGDLFIEQE